MPTATGVATMGIRNTVRMTLLPRLILFSSRAKATPSTVSMVTATKVNQMVRQKAFKNRLSVNSSI